MFDKIFYYHSWNFFVLSLKLKKYFICDHFSLSYGVSKIANSANLGQLTRDRFRAIIM